MITYEFPLNERIRTLLRLEDLFARFAFYRGQHAPPNHHSALLVLFEIIEVASRADLKSDLLQELERQRLVLEGFRASPEVAEDRLETTIERIEVAQTHLRDMSGRIGQHIRDNEWLMAIKQRTTIPGGTCEFDLPSYHYWLHLPPTARIEALNRWEEPLTPLQEGLTIVLRLLRDSGRSFPCIASKGSFQQMSGGKLVQLLRVTLEESWPTVPELSANKYMINVRFVGTNPLGGERLKQYPDDIPFDLTFCNLG